MMAGIANETLVIYNMFTLETMAQRVIDKTRRTTLIDVGGRLVGCRVVTTCMNDVVRAALGLPRMIGNLRDTEAADVMQVTKIKMPESEINDAKVRRKNEKIKM